LPSPLPDWRFAIGSHGKPEVIGPANAPRLRLSLSHTRGLAAAVLMEEHDIGIDVEWLGRPVASGDVATRFFAPAECAILEAAPPAFAEGDTVRARNLNPPGHTRLPRYARGHVGVVVALHGAHVFPDSHAHGKGEDPHPLYTVRFTATELWGAAANPRDSVCLDLWEPYLERA